MDGFALNWCKFAAPGGGVGPHVDVGENIVHVGNITLGSDVQSQRLAWQAWSLVSGALDLSGGSSVYRANHSVDLDGVIGLVGRQVDSSEGDLSASLDGSEPRGDVGEGSSLGFSVLGSSKGFLNSILAQLDKTLLRVLIVLSRDHSSQLDFKNVA